MKSARLIATACLALGSSFQALAVEPGQAAQGEIAQLLSQLSALANAPQKGAEFIIKYTPKFFPAGEKMYLVDHELKEWPQESPITPVAARIVTDGVRFRSDLLPDAGGTVNIPASGLNSPFLIFDGTRYLHAYEGGIRLTNDRPYAGFPIPAEMLTMAPNEIAPTQCPNWTNFCAGNYLDILNAASKSGDLTVRKLTPTRRAIELHRPDGGPFLIVEYEDSWPLWPARMVSGFEQNKVPSRSCEVEFLGYANHKGLVIPSEIVATLKLDMARCFYSNKGYEKQKERLRSLGVPMSGIVTVFEHRLKIEPPKEADVNEAVKVSIEPGTEIFDVVKNEHYVWGAKLNELGKQIK